MTATTQVLSGQVAVVTGAGRGIGRAIACAYAQARTAVCCAARTLQEIVGPVVTAMSALASAQNTGVSAIESEWVKTPDDVVPLALFLATQPAKGPTAQSFSLMRRDT